ncbi:MAG: hypothetical protein AAF990_11365, partial [Bacteroidota bacterium]
MNISTNLLRVIGIAFILLSSVLMEAQCPTGQTSNTYCYGRNEVDVVAFEFCPSSGMVARSTITAGLYNSILPANLEGLTVYEGASGSGTGGTIVFGPADGDLTGTVITASAPDLCLIFVSNSNAINVATTCQDGTATQLEVCSQSLPASTVTFAAPADLCENASVQTGLSGGNPSGGAYSGSGVTDDGNGMTYSFDPAAAGVGIATITYMQGGNAAMDSLEIFDATISFTAPADLCIDEGIQTGLGGGLPIGGVYSGNGVTDNGNGTYTFNPGAAGLGVTTITYTGPAPCFSQATDDIEVLAACGCPIGQTNFFGCYGNNETDAVLFEVCPTAGMAANATITAGSFGSDDNLRVYRGASGSVTSGDLIFGPANGDVSGNIIDGGAADQCLIFVVSSGALFSCQDGVEAGLAVCGTSVAPAVTLILLDDFCIDEGIQMGLSGGTPSGGVYSGSGVTDDGNGMTFAFDPMSAGVGTTTVTYTLGGDADDADIEVFALPIVAFTAPNDVCINESQFLSTALGSPAGGVYSGPGVTNIGNGLSFLFDPATAGIGTHTITYSFTDANGCSGSATDDIEVLPIPTFTAPADLCVDAGVQNGLGGGTPVGGVYSGPGVTDDGNGMTYSFDPSAAGVGVHTITYTIAGNPCPVASDDIEVFDLPAVSLSTAASYCLDAAIQNTPLIGGMPAGGVYSGPGVTDNGLGTGYFLDPTVGGPGTISIIYTLTDANGCTNADTSDIEIIDCGFVITDPCRCLNNATVIDPVARTGGMDGQFSELISIVDETGAMLPSGQTWTVTAASQAFDAFNIPAVGVQSAGVPIATDGSVTLSYNMTLGTYELPFVHEDRRAYSITIEGPFGAGSPVNQSFTISNACQYPHPIFDPQLPDAICAFDPVILLGGRDTNNIAAENITFTIDGNPATFFDPSVLSPGDRLVVMTFDGADDGNNGISPDGGTTFASPGCIQTVQRVVNIGDRPPVITCPPNNFGLPMGCNPMVPAAATTFNLVGDLNPDPALPTVAEGCGTVTLSSNDVTSEVDCIRTVERTYTAIDQTNNSSQCVQTFTFTVDTEAPVFNEALPMDATVECDAIPAAVMLTAMDNCAPGTMPMTIPFVFINEIHYDNVGTDAGEFIEVAGTAGFDLSACQLVLYNGANGMTYDAPTILSGTIDDEGSGFGAVSFAYPVNGIQNGPDGVALVCNGVVIEFLSYEGSFMAVGGPADGMMSTDIGVSEDGGTLVGESLQRTGTGCPSSSFGWMTPMPESPGSLNMMQVFDPMACAMTNPGVAPFVRITEIHYDNDGTDSGEFIEVSGTAGFDLSTCELVLYNGANSMTYGMMSLSGMIDDEGAGFGAVSFAYPVDGIQNGSPDGVALVCNGMVVEFLSYEGSFTAMGGPADGLTSTDIGVSETSATLIGQSLQLGGTGCSDTDLSWSGPQSESPGSLNAGLTFAGCPGPPVQIVADFMESSVTASTCPQERTITRTWTATDACGNSTQHVQTLVVEDTTPPTFVCPPADTLVNCDSVPEAVDLTAFDNCDVSGITQTFWINEIHYDNTGTDVGEFIEIAGMAGVNLSFYSLALYNGANGELDQLVMLTGVIDDEGKGFGALSFAIPGIMNGSPDGVALVQNSNGATLAFLSWEGTFMAVDGPAVGMTSTDIGVSEPNTTPIGESLQLKGSGTNGTDFTWTAPSAESPGSLNADQMVIGNLMATYLGETAVPGSCPQEMTLTRTWEVTDACGNTNTHTQTLMVQDTTPPTVVVVDVTVELDQDGMGSITAMDIDGGSTDNCSTNLTLTAAPMDFDCNDLGPNDVQLTVEDECGNSATATAVVTVEDNIAPIIACNNDLTITLDPGECRTLFNPVVFATDNCDTDVDIVQLEGPMDGDLLEKDTTYTYSYQATDDSGNTDVCVFTVTIEEFPNPSPSLSCNDMVNVSLDTLCEALITPDVVLEGGPYGCLE